MSERMSVHEAAKIPELHEKLADFRAQAKQHQAQGESGVLRGRVELDDDHLEVSIGTINNEVPESPIYVRIGEDLRKPEMHDWLAVYPNGEVLRHKAYSGDFYPVDDPSEVELLNNMMDNFVLQATKNQKI